MLVWWHEEGRVSARRGENGGKNALIVEIRAFELEVGRHNEGKFGIAGRCVDDEDGDQGVGLIEVDGGLEGGRECALPEGVADVAAVAGLHGEDGLDGDEGGFVGDGGGGAEVAVCDKS